MWFNQSQNQNQSDAHDFSGRGYRCRAVEDQLFTPGAQRVALASFYPQQHIPDPIQIPLVEVVAGPASLACVSQQAVQESIGKNQCLPVSHRATRHFLAAMNDGRRWLRCPIGPDLSTEAADILKELRNISCQFSDHANGTLTLSALRRFGWVLPQPVRRSRSRNQETGRRGHSASRLPAHRFDESPDDYSLASCSPAELASASPSDHQLAMDRPAEPLLTIKRECAYFPVSHQWGSAQSKIRHPCTILHKMHKPPSAARPPKWAATKPARAVADANTSFAASTRRKLMPKPPPDAIPRAFDCDKLGKTQGEPHASSNDQDRDHGHRWSGRETDGIYLRPPRLPQYCYPGSRSRRGTRRVRYGLRRAPTEAGPAVQLLRPAGPAPVRQTW